MRRRVVAVACVVVVLAFIVGGAFVLARSAFHENTPSADEMPSAQELPIPPDLRLTNGRCVVAGTAGCYRGVQSFDVERVAGSDGSRYACKAMADYLDGLGWVTVDEAKSRLPAVEWDYRNPAGTLTAHCEVLTAGRGSTEVTLTWPGKTELVPFDS